jgi:hypothetical protein
VYSYHAYGLGITSAFALPELVSGSGTVDVEIRSVAALPRDGPPLCDGAEAVAPGVWRLTYDDLGVVTIHDGSLIEVALAPDVEGRTLRAALLGPALAVLLEQRGFLVLHASVVQVGARAIAFLGDSGWGKSTIAAALHARGHRLVSDDHAVLRFTATGVEVSSAFPQFKLWPDAARALGHDPAMLPFVEPGFEKRARRIEDGFTVEERLPLARLFLLDAGEAVAISPLSSRDAFLALVRHTYGIEWTHEHSGGRQFQQRAELARRVPVQQLSRPWDLGALGRVVALIESELAGDD